MKRKVLYARITEEADSWLTEQSKSQGISKNDIIQLLINKAMNKT